MIPPLYLLAYEHVEAEPPVLSSMCVMDRVLAEWLCLPVEEHGWYTGMFVAAARSSPTVQGLRAVIRYITHDRHNRVHIRRGIVAAALAGNRTTLAYLLSLLGSGDPLEWRRDLVSTSDYQCFRMLVDHTTEHVRHRAYIDTCRVRNGFELDLVTGPIIKEEINSLRDNLQASMDAAYIIGHDLIHGTSHLPTFVEMDHDDFVWAAVRHGHAEVVEQYFAASKNAPDQRARNAALDWAAWHAASYGHDEIFHRCYRPESTSWDCMVFYRLPSRFYRYLPRVDADKLRPAMRVAIRTNNLPLVRYLIAAGCPKEIGVADLDEEDEQLLDILHRAGMGQTERVMHDEQDPNIHGAAASQGSS